MINNLNLENVIRIIYSDLVPENDPDGLDFEIDNDAEVNVKKPYTDNDGDSRGNSIFISGKINDVEILFFVNLAEDNQSFMTLFRTKSQEKFTILNQATPENIQIYFIECFLQILEEIQYPQENNDAHIIQLINYAEQFKPYTIPIELENLLEFQNSYPDYADGFFLRKDTATAFAGFCDVEAMQQEFSQTFYPIAVANGSGSVYAIWDNGNEKQLSNMPVIVFGDEGGVHLVADNLKVLMQQLTCDTEISVRTEDCYFYKDEDDHDEEPYSSDYKDEYTAWLKKHYKLNVIDIKSANSLIVQAQKKHQIAFDAWLQKYIPYQYSKEVQDISTESVLEAYTAITYENAKRFHFQFRDKITSVLKTKI